MPNKAINSGRIAASPLEWRLTGGVQPLAITMNEGVYLAVEVDQSHIQRRLDTGYCDEMASTLDEALNQIREACNQGQPLSIGLIGNAADIYSEWVSIHHGGGVSIGYSIHAGQVIVADCTPEAAERLSRVLTDDAGMGVIRHVDAGYEEAIELQGHQK